MKKLEVAANQFAVSLHDKPKRFFQIAARFRESAALRIHAANCLDGSDVPLSAVFDDCGELSFHG